MGELKQIVTALHQSTKRDYIGRMLDGKVDCMIKAKEYEYDYWDGNRRFGYGGYTYDGRWKPIAQKLISMYRLDSNSKVLDVGCGKAHIIYELKKMIPDIEIVGMDRSVYGLSDVPEEISEFVINHRAEDVYPWDDKYFDLVISLNCLHNLRNYELDMALREIERVGKSKYVLVESYRNEQELFNLQCWVLTGQIFMHDSEWKWFFNRSGYDGDYEFIYFE